MRVLNKVVEGVMLLHSLVVACACARAMQSVVYAIARACCAGMDAVLESPGARKATAER